MGIHILTDKQLRKLIASQKKDAAKAANESMEKELLIKQANIASLQAQITPHFLYNTLECIRGQAIIEGSQSIADTALALSRFFRYSISQTGTLMTLRDELTNADNYIQVQKFRFKDRFELKLLCDSEDETLFNSLIPKLTLQPLIENAIIHGLESKPDGGIITVEMIRVGDKIRITVSDNGCGIERNTLRDLNQWIREYYEDDRFPQSGGKRFGMALANVNKRIKLQYGEEYGLTVYSLLGSGTDIELYLPVMLANPGGGQG